MHPVLNQWIDFNWDQKGIVVCINSVNQLEWLGLSSSNLSVMSRLFKIILSALKIRTPDFDWPHTQGFRDYTLSKPGCELTDRIFHAKATGIPIRLMTILQKQDFCRCGDCRLNTFRPNNIEIISVFHSKLSTSWMILVPKMVRLEALRLCGVYSCLQHSVNQLKWITRPTFWGWLMSTRK